MSDSSGGAPAQCATADVADALDYAHRFAGDDGQPLGMSQSHASATDHNASKTFHVSGVAAEDWAGLLAINCFRLYAG